MVNSIYELAVNADGTQDSEYYLGNKLGGLPIPILLIYQTTSTSSTIKMYWNYGDYGQTGFEIEQYIDGTSTDWSSVHTTNATARDWEATTLPASTRVGHRIRAKSATLGDSGWSDEFWQYTTAASNPTGLIFADDFSTYQIGQTLNSVEPPVSVDGARWKAPTGETHPKIVSGGLGASDKALGFRFLPKGHPDKASANEADGSAYCEQQFILFNNPQTRADQFPELWVEIAVYWPTNYKLSQSTSSGQHNKTLLIRNIELNSNNPSGTAGADQGFFCEHYLRNSNAGRTQVNLYPYLYSTTPGGSYERWGWPLDYNASHGPIYHAYDALHNYQYSNIYNQSSSTDDSKLFFDAATDLGKWRTYRWHIKCASAVGTGNGIQRCWKDNVKIFETIDNDWVDSTYDMDGGYIFGWWGLGVEEECIVKVGSTKFYDADPNWDSVSDNTGTDLSNIYYSEDFDSFSVDSALNDISTPFYNTNAKVTNELTHGGNKVIKDTIPPIANSSTQVFADWGFTFDDGTLNIAEGEEVWWRIWMYYPTGYQFVEVPRTARDGVKFMRMIGSAPGYSDIYYRHNPEYNPLIGLGDFSWWYTHEALAAGPDDARRWMLDYGDPKPMSLGEWHCAEVYTKFSSTAGVVRFWLDGVQLGPTVQQKTLTGSGETINKLYYHTNREYIPNIGTQHHYWGDVAVAVHTSGRDDTSYLDTDINGNKFIGLNY